MTDLILEWPTYILSGTMSPDALAALQKRASDPAGILQLEDAIGPIAGPSPEALAFGGAAICGPRIETWSGGHLESLCDDSPDATHIVIVVLDESCDEAAQPAHYSGTLMIRDPRAGCANVFAPGLPYGRPFEFAARPGAYICYPAWLRCAVLPVSGGHEIRLLRAKLVAKQSGTQPDREPSAPSSPAPEPERCRPGRPLARLGLQVERILKSLMFESISVDVTRLQVGLVCIGLASDAFRYAFAWWVLKINGSVVEFGSLLAAMTFAQTIATLGVGALGDMWNPMKVLRAAVCLQGATIAVLAGWAGVGHYHFPLAMFLSIILSLFVGAIEPLTNVAIASVAPTGQVTQVMAQRGALASGAKLLGPLLAGAMVSLFGAPGTLLAAAVFAGASCLIFVPLRGDNAHRAEQRGAMPFLSSWMRKTVAGIRTFYHVKVDFYFCVMTCMANFALPAFFLVALPYLIIHVLKLPASTLGILDGFFCAGMFVGGMRMVSWLNRRIGKQHAVSLSMLLLAAMIFSFTLTRQPVVMGSALFIGGMFMMTIFVNIGGLRAVATPKHYRARMFAIASFLVSLSIAPGIAFVTFTTQRAGIDVSLGSIAGICMLSATAIYLIPNARKVLEMTERDAENAYQRLYPSAFFKPDVGGREMAG
ncbi:MFS transporter [Burkholderia lata]|nr:MFS transporter [Burkholderia lata]